MPAMPAGAGRVERLGGGAAAGADWRGGGLRRLGLLADFPYISGGNSA